MSGSSSDKKEENQIVIGARERGPGPGRYALPSTCGYFCHDPTRKKQPAYSFGDRLGLPKSEASPGPAYFVHSYINRHGKDGTPSYSILGRQNDPNSFKTPSPGAYSPEKVHPPGERHAPIYSMGARTRYRKRDCNPAPSRYSLPLLLGPKQPNKLSYPSYSMTGHSNAGSYTEDLSKTPGPGQYNAIEPNIIRSKRPMYSLQGRSYMPCDGTIKPGPGAHSPEKVVINKPSAPKYNLGIRHSEFVAPLIIQVD